MEQKWEQSLNAQVEPVALLRRLPSLEHMGQMGLARQLGVVQVSLAASALCARVCALLLCKTGLPLRCWGRGVSPS